MKIYKINERVGGGYGGSFGKVESGRLSCGCIIEGSKKKGSLLRLHRGYIFIYSQQIIYIFFFFGVINIIDRIRNTWLLVVIFDKELFVRLLLRVGKKWVRNIFTFTF